MKILKISLRVLLVAIAAILITIVVLASLLRRSGLPDLSGDEKLTGLISEVRVSRDERGVSHIYANNSHDLYFVTGYIAAQERLWQMDLIRRATNGELSEILGKDYVETDLFLRSLNMKGKSDMVLAGADPEIVAAAQAYADGVNAWIARRGKKLPAEFRILGYTPAPWTLTDMANIIGYMGWDLASDNLSAEINNYKLVMKLGREKAMMLIPDWELVDEIVFPGFVVAEEALNKSMSFIGSLKKLEELGIVSFSGSNNWAVSGSRSKTGRPIMSNDMHLGLGVPGIWMQIHQVIPGELNVTGVMIPGEPFIVAGHNEKIAWGMTNLMVDDIDLFIESTDTSGNYLYNGGWLPMKQREEVITIKGGSTETRKIFSTHRGPIISEMRGIKDVVLSMRWSGFDYSDEISAVYKLNRAENWNEFRDALGGFRSISQNFVYADVEGNIGLQTGGGIPLRKGTGLLPRDGSTDEFDWKGYVPFELLPWSFNPPDGFVSSANQRTVGNEYPFYIAGSFAMPFRINRIREMARERQMMGLEDFTEMITDIRSDFAARLTPAILRVAEKESFAGESMKKAIDALKDWDYRMAPELVAPTLFEFIRMELAKNLLNDELAELYGGSIGSQHDYYLYRILATGSDEWVDNINTPVKETIEEIMALSFRAAIDTLTARYGKFGKKWQWGRIHTMTFKHPMGNVKLLDMLLSLNSKKYGAGGSYHTVAPFAFTEDFKSNHGASERHIFSTADWDKSLTVIPTGTSGIPGSPFYLSQTNTYMNNGFYTDPFTAEAVKAATTLEIIFRPGQ